MKKTHVVVNSLWIDPVIGDLQILCIKSFLDQNVEFNLYTYDEITNAPTGIIIKNANDIMDRSEVFKDNQQSYATFSDWFRVKLLHTVGGWWVDCDVYCIKPFNLKAPYIFATEGFFIEEERHVKICNAVIKMPANSVFGEKVLAAITKKLKTVKHTDIKWTEIGAKILYDMIVEENLYNYVLLPEVFCPTDYVHYKQLADVKNLFFSEVTYGVHLWNKLWEWNNLDPLAQATEHSFFDNIKLTRN